MSDKYETYLKISGEASMQVESFVHEIRKNAADGQRFGVNLDVERVELDDQEAEFERAEK